MSDIVSWTASDADTRVVCAISKKDAPFEIADAIAEALTQHFTVDENDRTIVYGVSISRTNNSLTTETVVTVVAEIENPDEQEGGPS